MRERRGSKEERQDRIRRELRSRSYAGAPADSAGGRSTAKTAQPQAPRARNTQVELDPNATFNGTFTFAGTETGSDFADFLLGIPSNYIQSSGGVFHLRNKYGAVFAQDSWRVHPTVTFNYGLRWDVMQPWYERDNQIQTIIPGAKSVVYPGAPAGL